IGQGQAAVAGAAREHHRVSRDLLAVVETHDVAVPVAGGRLERDGAVRRGQARPELARLRDGAAGELRAADAAREAEVVLDPPRRARLAAERRALQDQGVEPLRGAVDGRAQPAWARADNEQVDLLARRELAPDAERAQHVAA